MHYVSIFKCCTNKLLNNQTKQKHEDFKELTKIKVTVVHCLCVCRYRVSPRVSEHARWDAGGRAIQWASHNLHQRAGSSERGKAPSYLLLSFRACFTSWSWYDSACDVWSRRSFCDNYLPVFFLVFLFTSVLVHLRYSSTLAVFCLLFRERLSGCFRYSMNNGHRNYMSKLRNRRCDGSDNLWGNHIIAHYSYLFLGVLDAVRVLFPLMLCERGWRCSRA